MVHFDEHHLRDVNPVGRLFRRIIGIGCVIAVPGIWIAAGGALPEARILGLALSVMVMGLAGLCFMARR